MLISLNGTTIVYSEIEYQKDATLAWNISQKCKILV